MRVTFVNHYGNTHAGVGPTRSFELAKQLAYSGHVCELWISRFNHYTGRYEQPAIAVENGVEVTRLWTPPYRRSLLMRGLNILVFDLVCCLKILFSATSRNVVVFVSPPTVPFTRLACLIRRIPFVLDVQDLWPEFLVGMGLRNGLVTSMMQHTSRWLYKSATRVMAVSESMRAYITHIRGRNDVVLAPLGVDVDRYQCSGGVQSARPGHMTVIYCGAHNPANGLENLLEVASLLKDRSPGVRFVLVGDGASKKRLLEIADSLRLTNVVFRDPVPARDVPNLLSQADVCITLLQDIPVFRMVRPNKIYEYMAASRPIVCCIPGEAGEVVLQAQAGFVFSSTEHGAIAERLAFLASSPSLRVELGSNGRRWVEKHGDRRCIAEIVSSLLTELTSA